MGNTANAPRTQDIPGKAWMGEVYPEIEQDSLSHCLLCYNDNLLFHVLGVKVAHVGNSTGLREGIAGAFSRTKGMANPVDIPQQVHVVRKVILF